MSQKARGASIDYQTGVGGTLVARATLVPAGATWNPSDPTPVWSVSDPTALSVDQSKDPSGLSCILTGLKAATNVIPTITGTVGGVTITASGDGVDIAGTPATGFNVTESAS